MKDALENLKYFIGKPVTVITTQINREFDEVQKCDYFVGIVSAIDSLGIWTTHALTKCRNFYPYTQICSISEEQKLDPSNPAHAKMIQEIETKRKPEVKTTSPLVDINSLSKLTGH